MHNRADHKGILNINIAAGRHVRCGGGGSISWDGKVRPPKLRPIPAHGRMGGHRAGHRLGPSGHHIHQLHTLRGYIQSTGKIPEMFTMCSTSNY